MSPFTRPASRCTAVILMGLALALAEPPSAHARLFPSLKARTAPTAIARVPGLPTDAELEAAGARVGVIHFDARRLFDVDAGDENTTLGRLGNRLHIQTRIATIEDQLLFRGGDLYQSRLLEESARILRETPQVEWEVRRERARESVKGDGSSIARSLLDFLRPGQGEKRAAR